MSEFIYADNAATTKLDSKAFSAMEKFMVEEYANVSQPYSFSRTSKIALKDSRTAIAECINCNSNEIFFTSGGSESDNWVVKQFGDQDGQKVIITSKIEHHAILNSCESIRNTIKDLIYLDVDETGVVSQSQLIKALEKYKGSNAQILVSIMAANNEIGTIEPIKELARITHQYGGLFHTDAVQALGHIKIDVKDMDVDYLSASSHKFNGPKGIGFLYIKNGSPIRPLINGGSQEKGYRAGTESVSLVVGMATALKENVSNLEANKTKLLLLEKKLIESLNDLKLDFIRNGNDNHLPGLVNLSFKGRNGEMILHRMDLMKCFISTGSACDSVNNQISHVIKAIKVSSEYAEGTIRISFGKYNSLDDPAKIAKMLNSIVNSESVQKVV